MDEPPTVSLVEAPGKVTRSHDEEPTQGSASEVEVPSPKHRAPRTISPNKTPSDEEMYMDLFGSPDRQSVAPAIGRRQEEGEGHWQEDTC